MQKIVFFSFVISIASVIVISEAGFFGDYDSIGQSIQSMGFGGRHSQHRQASNDGDGIQSLGFGGFGRSIGGGSGFDDYPSEPRYTQNVGMGGSFHRRRSPHGHGNGGGSGGGGNGNGNGNGHRGSKGEQSAKSDKGDKEDKVESSQNKDAVAVTTQKSIFCNRDAYEPDPGGLDPASIKMNKHFARAGVNYEYEYCNRAKRIQLVEKKRPDPFKNLNFEEDFERKVDAHKVYKENKKKNQKSQKNQKNKKDKDDSPEE